jgi:hypothetical protein
MSGDNEKRKPPKGTEFLVILRNEESLSIDPSYVRGQFEGKQTRSKYFYMIKFFTKKGN